MEEKREQKTLVAPRERGKTNCGIRDSQPAGQSSATHFSLSTLSRGARLTLNTFQGYLNLDNRLNEDEWMMEREEETVMTRLHIQNIV